MKVLLVSRGVFSIPPKHSAGAELHVYKLANALAQLGHEIHYVTDITENGTFHRNVLIHAIESPPFSLHANFGGWVLSHIIGNIRAFRSAFNALKLERFGFDVIHGHGNLSSLLLLNVRKSVPLIYTIHDPTPYMCRYPSWQERAIRQASFKCVDLGIWHRADHIIAVSSALRKELVRWGVSPQKISVIFSGVDTEFLKRNNDYVSPGVQAKYRIKDRYCLFVGRLTPRKGIECLLRALVETNITCVIVGEGPQRDDLILLANRLGIKDKVIFTGYVPKSDLKELYAGASFFVFPSLADVGVTLTILEALSSGLPVIATDIPGTGEVVRDGYNGFLIPPQRDVEALRSKIQLLVENTELCKMMGMKARRTVGRKFSWRSVAEKTTTVYESLMKS